MEQGLSLRKLAKTTARESKEMRDVATRIVRSGCRIGKLSTHNPSRVTYEEAVCQRGSRNGIEKGEEGAHHKCMQTPANVL